MTYYTVCKNKNMKKVNDIGDCDTTTSETGDIKQGLFGEAEQENENINYVIIFHDSNITCFGRRNIKCVKLRTMNFGNGDERGIIFCQSLEC